MRRSLLLFLIMFPALCAVGKNDLRIASDQVSDTVFVDSVIYYRAEVKKLEDTIAQLRNEIIAKAATIDKKTIELNDMGKKVLKLYHERDSINRELKAQVALKEHLREAFESETFYTLLLYLPIKARFDSVDIANKKDFIETLHLKEVHPKITEIYYDMMVNYQTYLQEVIECVGLVLDEFRLSGSIKPDIDYVKRYYMSKLERTQYWRKRHAKNQRTEIPFIEERLKQINVLFSDDNKYTKDAFQKIYNDLIRR